MYTSTEVLAWIGIAGGIGFFTGIAVTLSYEDLLDKKRRKRQEFKRSLQGYYRSPREYYEYEYAG